MPSPGASPAPRLPLDDAYLELLADTLEGMDSSARGQFLQRYFRATTHLNLVEGQCLELWDEMLTRRRALSQALNREVSLKTALMDALSAAGLVRVPVILEYDELRKIELSAVTDPLTGLYNRRLFAESFEKELNRARRYGQPLGIVLLDLHRFKEVNDRFGHPRGDEVLRVAATTLQKSLRTSDSAFRIGGDEFALLLPQTDATQALALSNRVESVFAEALRPLAVTFGVNMDHGIATFPHDGDHPDQLIRVADERLYRFKHANETRASAKPFEASGQESQREPRPTAGPIDIARAAQPHGIPFAAAPTNMGATLDKEPGAPPVTPVYAVQRKAERVSMSGTNAYAVIGEQGDRRARVLDLGFGGVALEFERPGEYPENIVAVLHVPILPPLRVNLKPVWSRRTTEGTFRIGCHFVS